MSMDEGKAPYTAMDEIGGDVPWVYETYLWNYILHQ